MREGYRNMLLFGTLFLGLGVVGALYSFGSGSQTYEENQTFAAANVTTIQVDASSVDINLLPGHDDQVLVHFYGRGQRDKYSLTAEEFGGYLKIAVDANDRWSWGFNSGSDLHLDVTVPQKVYDELKVNTSSGDILTRDLQIRNVLLSANSGDIDVADIQGEHVEVSTSSGDVKATDIVGLATLQTNSGEIEGHNLKHEDRLEIRSNGGKQRLTSVEGDQVSFISDAGSITARSVTAKRVEMESGSGTQTLSDGSAETLRMTANSGTVDLEQFTTQLLEVKTSSGRQRLRDVSGAVVSNSSSGSIDLYMKELKQDLDLEANSGTVNLYLPSDAAFSFNTYSSSGKPSFVFAAKFEQESKNGSIGTVGTGGPRIKVKTDSGDIKFRTN